MRSRSAIALALVLTLLLGILPSSGAAPRALAQAEATSDWISVSELDTPTARHFQKGDLNRLILTTDPVQARNSEGQWAPVQSQISAADHAPAGFRYEAKSGFYTAWLPSATGGSVRVEVQGQYFLEFGMGETGRLAPPPKPAPPQESARADSPVQGQETGTDTSGPAGVEAATPPATDPSPPIAETTPAAESPAPEVAGGKAAFRDADAAVRYEYQVEPLQLKEGIVLETPRPSFDVRIPLAVSEDLQAVTWDDDIQVWRKDYPGVALFRIEPAWAEDAKGIPTPVTQELINEGDQQFLHLAMDPAWLSDPERAWPVTIDPTVRVSGGESAARAISSGTPDQNTAGFNQQIAYKNNWDGQEGRALSRFDTTILGRQRVGRIVSATLNVSVSTRDWGGAFSIHSLARGWEPNRVSWRHADRYAKIPWTSPGGDIARTLRSVTLGAWKDHTEAVDVTGLVRSWFLGGEANNGFIVTCSPTSDGFCHGSTRATLDITYETDTAPPSVAITSPSGGTLGSATTVTASASDNYGVQKVEFLVDGAVVGADDSAPFELSVNPAQFPVGSHTLAARAWDQAGNPATSAPVAVSFTGGIAPVAAPSTGPDPSPPQPQLNPAYLSGEELGLDRRWGYAPLPVPGGYLRLSNGNLVLTATESVLPGPRLATVFRRTYNSRVYGTWSFANNWIPNIQQMLYIDGDRITWVDADGSSIRFQRQADGYWRAGSGVYEWILRNGDGTYDLFHRDYLFTRFTAQGLVQSLHDRNGNAITYITEGNGRVTGVRDAVGRTAQLSHNANGWITQITDAAGRTFRYEYEGWKLVRVTGPDAYSWHYGYQASTSFLTSITDPTGRRWRLDYDTAGRLTGIQDPAGQSTRIAYGNGETTVTSPLGHVTRFGWGAAGQLTYAVDPLGNRTSFGLDSNFNVTSVTDPNGAVTTISYDGAGNPTTVRDALGNTTTTTYNSYNQPTSVTDALGKVSRMEYDSRGNLTRTVDPSGAATTFTYDGRGMRTAATSPVGGTTQFGYDSYARLIQVTDAAGAVTRNAYNSLDLPSSTTDPRGGATSFEYDALGRLHRVRYPGPLQESEFSVTDAAGRILRQIDATGGHTTFTYDNAGRPIAITDPLGRVTRAEYDADGRLLAVVDPLGNRTVQAFDAASRLTAVTDPLGNTSRAQYDAAGRQVAVIDPTGNTTRFSYDALGRMTAMTNPLGAQASYSYDALGQLTAYRNPLGNATTYGYDARGLLTQVTDALGAATRYSYDAAGRRTAVADARGNSTSFTFDLLGRVVQETRPGNLVARFGYDASGNQTSRTDFNGRTTAYTYDARNRLTAISYPRNGQVSIEYDAAGRRTRMTDAVGTHSWAYDAAGQLVRARDWMGYTLEYEYDAAGRKIRGGSQTYAYDAASRMTKAPGVEYSYDPRGLVTKKSFSSGVEQRFSYDAAGFLSELRALRSTGADLRDVDYYNTHLRYQRDRMGQITGVSNNHATSGWQQRYTYTYDAAGRLTRFAEIERQPVDYRYDAVGNRIEDDKAWYAYDANNRLTQQTAKPNWGESAQFTYDNNGNLLRKATSPEIREYSYDDENRMVYERMGRMQCGWDDCWYNYYDVDRHRYNGDGQKVHTQSNFASETGGLFIRYDGADPIADLKHTDGKPMANYYRGLGGEPVAVQNENGNTYEYLLDERKSVRWLATSRELAPTESYCGCESPQWVTNTYRYDAFGVQMGNSSGMAYNPLRYTGARYEPDNGMYLMGARYYIPQVGRFLTQDTWRGTPWTPWTQHLYSYTGNNPINFIDPTGHLPRSTFILGEDSGAGNPAVTVIIRAFIPQAVVSNPVNGEKFKGDGRGPQYEGGTHRIEMMFSITPGTTDAVLIKSAGLTVNLSTGETGRASLENVNIGGVELVDGVTRVGFYGAASDPLVSYAQPLDIFGWVGVDAHGNVAVAGVHDGAPSYEVWVKTEGDLPELIYSYESASLLTLGLPPYVVFSGEYRRPVPWRSQIARN